MNKIFNILFFVVIASAHGARKETLNQTFRQFQFVLERPQYSELKKIFTQANLDCFKEHLNLDKYGKKLVNEFELDLLYEHLAIVCFENAPIDIFSYEQKVSLQPKADLINCLKSKLFELEPTSQMITASDQENIRTCKSKFVNLLPNKLRNEYVNFNALITNLTCGKVSSDEFTRNFIKKYLIDLIDLEEDIKKSEENQIRDEAKFIRKSAFDCIMKRFDEEDENKV